MRNLATTERRHVEDLYGSFGWELADEYGHVLEAFKRLLTEPKILDKYQIPHDIKTALLKNIEMRLTPQPVKVGPRQSSSALRCPLFLVAHVSCSFCDTRCEQTLR